MRKVNIVAVGRLRESALRTICEDYYRRCRARFQIEEIELRDDKALNARMNTTQEFLIVLDERGKEPTSREFANQLETQLIESNSPITFVIGGADGVGEKVRARANRLISFGKMTIAHQLVRVILAEQLYRAVSLMEGAPYHRD